MLAVTVLSFCGCDKDKQKKLPAGGGIKLGKNFKIPQQEKKDIMATKDKSNIKKASGPEQAFDCLAVSEVKVFPFREGPSLGRMKALAEIVLNDQFIVRGLRIMESENGLYISYPVDPFVKGDDYKSICNPITRQLREHIENTVLEKYTEMQKG